jgi:hypothetical protein
VEPFVALNFIISVIVQVDQQELKKNLLSKYIKGDSRGRLFFSLSPLIFIIFTKIHL